VLEVSGTVPLAAGEPAPVVGRNVAVVNPTIYFAQSVKDGLVARGIDVFGGAADMDDLAAELLDGRTGERRVLATAESPTLREIGAVLMKVSQNQYAETLLKAAGAARGGLGTAAAGRRTFVDVLTAWGLPPGSYVLQDGSGLSRYNYVTASGLIAILEQMHKDERHREAFLATMPVAGEDGTLASRMARHAGRRQRAGEDGIDRQRPVPLRLRPHARRRAARLFHPRQRLHVPAATITWMADLGVEILSNFTRQ
jgi:serine-type D-Ala-D-Ala carboxypeptidase/endopeptidase (penicillin-binding protein 4)